VVRIKIRVKFDTILGINSWEVIENNGGRDRTRTCDLLRVNNRGYLQAFYLLLAFPTTWGVCFRSADIL
jgi:hypothetical protein